MPNYGNDVFVGTVGYGTPVDVVVNGVTYRNQEGQVYRVIGNQLIPITSQERTMLEKLDPQVSEVNANFLNNNSKPPGKSNSSDLILGAGILFILFMINRRK